MVFPSLTVVFYNVVAVFACLVAVSLLYSCNLLLRRYFLRPLRVTSGRKSLAALWEFVFRERGSFNTALEYTFLFEEFDELKRLLGVDYDVLCDQEATRSFARRLVTLFQATPTLTKVYC